MTKIISGFIGGMVYCASIFGTFSKTLSADIRGLSCPFFILISFFILSFTFIFIWKGIKAWEQEKGNK